MNLDRVTPGSDVPEQFNVIIEIPAHSDPIKYEVDKDTGAMFVDRFMATAMHYPTNYGYVPNTLAQDGDPVDVLVVTPFPLRTGIVIRCRAIGMLNMSDESGLDAKIIAVPIKKLTSLYDKVKTYLDLPQLLLDQTAHFFEHYKDLEPGKWVKLESWVGPDEAKSELREGITRFNALPKKPHF